MKKILIAMLLIVFLAIPVLATECTEQSNTPMPSVKDVEILEFVKSVTFKITVEGQRYVRNLNWYKLEEGRLKSDIPYGLTDDEKKWYEMGYKMEPGEYGEPEDFQTSGSGVVIYSQKFKEPEFSLLGDKIYGETIGITNWHVVEMLIDYLSRGTRSRPLNVYADKDIITSNYPPSFEIKEEARPIKQAYYVVDTEGIYIQHSEKQLYDVRAELIAWDRALDIAVFRIENVFGLPYAIWRDTPCKVGEEVWISGAPLGIFRSVDKGMINQIELDLGESYGIIWDNQVKLDIPAAPGSSGSGIFDIYGNLIAQEHGVLVYQGNYISGGHLATSGMSIREWLIWSGFAFIVAQEPY